MFTTQSFPKLSPGIFLSIISHAFPPQFTHLFGNVAMLWLFGGECEQHMRKVEVVGFFVIASLVSVLLGTAISGQNTLGASGGILAFVGFYCVHMLGTHRESFDFETLTEAGSMGIRTHCGVVLAFTPIVVILYSFAQIFGLIPVGRTDAIGHLTGVSFGIAYAFIRSRI
jgi:membrane associated rhomboid family serine protease